MVMRGVIVLNKDNEPLGVVSIRRAVGYVVSNRVDIIEEADGDLFRSAGGDQKVSVPRVVRFKDIVPVPAHSNEMNWSRTKMLDRDLYTCGYCGKWGNTVDHIVPQSRGGKYTWMNTITACFKCNNFKADRTPEEAGMTLLFEPKPVYRTDTLLLAMAATGANIENLGYVTPAPRLVEA
jgi:5-methylcytosine-specific restriction endonuclease McrA